jgi:hypothetical protein
MRCHLPKGHEGAHQELFRDNTVEVIWSKDERDWEKMIKITEEGILYRCSLCSQVKNEDDERSDFYIVDGEHKVCCSVCYKEKVDDDTMKLRKDK